MICVPCVVFTGLLVVYRCGRAAVHVVLVPQGVPMVAEGEDADVTCILQAVSHHGPGVDHQHALQAPMEGSVVGTARHRGHGHSVLLN
jgi:hypothetical protein